MVALPKKRSDGRKSNLIFLAGRVNNIAHGAVHAVPEPDKTMICG
jgi:hypothetical protein